MPYLILPDSTWLPINMLPTRDESVAFYVDPGDSRPRFDQCYLYDEGDDGTNLTAYGLLSATYVARTDTNRGIRVQGVVTNKTIQVVRPRE